MRYSYSEIVGARLREVRIMTGYSVTQLARLFECSEDHYRRIERGVYTLSIEKLAKLYACAGVDPLFLIAGKRRWTEVSDDERDENQREHANIMKQLIGYCNSLTKED